MGWLLLLFIAVFLIWCWNRWYGSPARIMGKINDLSELYCKMIFEKLAEDIEACKRVREDFKKNKKLTQELKRYEELVFSFLSMIRKHKEVKEYVYIMKSDKETLDIERDWYRYCVAYLQLIDSKIEIVRTARDYPFAIKEVEEKFSGILLKRELKRNGT